jgi:glutamate:GABA antiporter
MDKSARVAGLTTFALVMLITSAIDNIRNLPTIALFGTALVFFFIFSAIVFLIPITLVSAELSTAWTKKNGIYHWVKLILARRIFYLLLIINKVGSH